MSRKTATASRSLGLRCTLFDRRLEVTVQETGSSAISRMAFSHIELRVDYCADGAGRVDVQASRGLIEGTLEKQHWEEALLGALSLAPPLVPGGIQLPSVALRIGVSVGVSLNVMGNDDERILVALPRVDASCTVNPRGARQPLCASLLVEDGRLLFCSGGACLFLLQLRYLCLRYSKALCVHFSCSSHLL